MVGFMELPACLLAGQKGMNFSLLGLGFSREREIKPVWGFI